MRISKLLLFISTLFITFTACQKESSHEIPNNTPGNNNGNTDPDDDSTGTDGDSTGSELGTWKFISMDVKTSEIMEATEEGENLKGVLTSEYTTIDNKGTVTFGNSKMSYTDLGYSLDAMALFKLYIDGILIDSMSLPFSGTIPTNSGTGDYQKIGADSIYAQASGPAVIDPGGEVGNSGIGYKLRWSGNRMTMAMKINTTRIDDGLGVPAEAKIEISAVMTLEKQ